MLGRRSAIRVTRVSSRNFTLGGEAHGYISQSNVVHYKTKGS